MLQIVLSPNKSSHNGCKPALNSGHFLIESHYYLFSKHFQNITEVHLSGKTEHSECSKFTSLQSPWKIRNQVLVVSAWPNLKPVKTLLNNLLQSLPFSSTYQLTHSASSISEEQWHISKQCETMVFVTPTFCQRRRKRIKTGHPSNRKSRKKKSLTKSTQLCS